MPEIVADVILILSLREIVADDPREISPPPVRLVPGEIVILELDKALLGILVKVLLLPERLLLVRVWVLLVKTNVPAAKVRLANVGLLACDRF